MAIYKGGPIYFNSMRHTTVVPLNLEGANVGDVPLPDNSTEMVLFHSNAAEIWLMQFFAEGVTPVAGDFTVANSFPILPYGGSATGAGIYHQNLVRINLGEAGWRGGKDRPWFYPFNQSGGSATFLTIAITVTTQVSRLQPTQKITGQL